MRNPFKEPQIQTSQPKIINAVEIVSTQEVEIMYRRLELTTRDETILTTPREGKIENGSFYVTYEDGNTVIMSRDDYNKLTQETKLEPTPRPYRRYG